MSKFFKSGVITQDKIILTPINNENLILLLKQMGFSEDTIENQSSKYVKVHLNPLDNDRTTEVSKWNYEVIQNITPDWYKENSKKYEAEFRQVVEEWMKENFVIICGKACVKVDEDEKGTYYQLADILFKLKFGLSNNYAESYIRANLQICDFAKELKHTYGARLAPVTIDLLSRGARSDGRDGVDDYGVIEGDITKEGDILGLRTYYQNEKWRQSKMPYVDSDTEFTSTPNSYRFTESEINTSSLHDNYVQLATYCDKVSGVSKCTNVGDVRPYFIIKS